MNTFVQDLRFGLRMLARSPGFTSVAIVTLALGIGANTAIFSVVNAALLRPLPYREPSRLVHLLWGFDTNWMDALSPLECQYWKEHSQVFEATAVYSVGRRGLNLSTGSEPAYVQGGEASKDLFRLLGAQPRLGRDFTAEEDRRGGPNAVILSDGLWRRRFGADPSIVGKNVILNARPAAIVGVLPGDFEFVQPFNSPVDLWQPLQLTVDPEDQGHNYEMIARLKPGVSPEQAQAQMDTLLAPFKRAYPKHLVPGERGVKLMTYRDWISRWTRAPLLLLFGAVGLVLVIAAVNVANLLLSRMAERQTEVAVRLALGASRLRLLQQFVTETLILALLGGAAGLLFAPWTLIALLALVPQDFPWVGRADVDLHVLGFAFLVSILTGVVGGLVPFLRSSNFDLQMSLKEGGRAGAAGPGRTRLRSSLVVGEVALSVVLLVAAMLFIVSLRKLWEVNPGFNPADVWTFRMSLSPDRFKTSADVWSFEKRVSDRLKALPGVVSVASASSMPFDESYNFGIQVIQGGERKNVYIRARAIDPQYFRTLGIPVLRGRPLLDADTAGSPRAVIVNEALARQCCAGTDVLGLLVYFGQPEPNAPLAGPGWEVVGVAGDTKDLGLDSPAPLTIYLAQAQVSDDLNRDMIAAYLPAWTVKATTSLDIHSVQGAVYDVDPGQPVVSLRRMTEVISQSLGVAFSRFLGTLLAGFAGLALVLAAVGLYGVVAFAVAQRTHEIGVRLALGAERSHVLTLVMRQGLQLALAGVLIGLPTTLALVRLISSYLYGVKPSDPEVLLGVSLLLILVALAACYIPARRATKVDPMVALRYE